MPEYDVFMRPSLTCVTLGVSDLDRSILFYRDGLGFQTTAKAGDPVAFFDLNGTVLSLYPRSALAEDAGVKEECGSFSGITLAHNVADKAEADAAMAHALQAGATVVKPMQDAFWGGYSGYFSDPDGYLWEVVWNPHWKMDQHGRISL